MQSGRIFYGKLWFKMGYFAGGGGGCGGGGDIFIGSIWNTYDDSECQDAKNALIVFVW
jgi:hypothetical protein